MQQWGRDQKHNLKTKQACNIRKKMCHVIWFSSGSQKKMFKNQQAHTNPKTQKKDGVLWRQQFLSKFTVENRESQKKVGFSDSNLGAFIKVGI